MGSEDAQKRYYLQYNAAVQQLIPSDQLLVFNVKEGWEPLCQFLNLPIPDFPFPDENKVADDGRIAIIDQSLGFDVMKQAERELKRSWIVLFCIFVVIFALN